ncbi:unnamed protein product [Pocillopora meandrina]|uniref:Uncharacterized protein n=1 Tax=Pocillopora meandrina TaxID=46732 RepID=A0AAU9XGJ2_9CNID|nr:unnamed protein product [Pocillopora meandrina]
MSKVTNSISGRDGRDGREGPAGPRGLKGPKGFSLQMNSNLNKGTRRTDVCYNRWGRKNCSGNATLVYTGFMGSGYYTHTGGGTNYVCLTNNPIYDEFVDGWQNTAAIYGTEYQASTFPDLKNLDQHDAPCAACYVRTRGSQIMIPGTNKCPSGWTREYKGHLMTSY